MIHLLKKPVELATRHFGYGLMPLQQQAMHKWLGLPDHPIKTILDIGACRGGFAQSLLMTNFPSAHIHCFEPLTPSFVELEKKANNSGGRMTAHHFALGQREERSLMDYMPDAPYASSFLRRTHQAVIAFPSTKQTEKREVSVFPLDSIAPTLKPSIQHDLLVKIDVQGRETDVIKGGLNTISSARACIIEIHNMSVYENQPAFHEIYLMMTELGFIFSGVLDQYLDKNGNILFYDAVFQR